MVAQLSKPIKPRKLNVAKVRLNLLNALRREGKAIAKEFDKTTASWQGEKPTFEAAISLTGNSATLLIGPGGSKKGTEKWVWADQGTKPHKIKAKNKPLLIYKKGYSAKTKVGFLGSFPGGSFGPFRSRLEVNHPGTKARGWSKLVVKRRRKRFIQAMNKAARVT